MKRLLKMGALSAAIGLAGQANAQFANTLFSENFNGLTLGPSVNERLGSAISTVLPGAPGVSPAPLAFTHIGPTGWTVDPNFDNYNTLDGISDLANAGGTPVYDATQPPNTVQLFKLGLPTVVIGNKGVGRAGDPLYGVDEWEGWSFADKNFWSSVDDQGRTGFTKGSGVVAVVDPDEYDDLAPALNPPTSGLDGNYYNSGLTSAAIPTNGLSTVKLSFDSSWLPESYDDLHTSLGYKGNNQSAMVWALFDNGQRDLLVDSLWDSDAGHTSTGPTDPIPTRPASPYYKADATNETVNYDVAVPAGATSVQFTFGFINAHNDWWWAIDNINVSDGANAPYYTEGFESVTRGSSVNEQVSNTPAHVTVKSSKPFTTPVLNAYTHTPPTDWSVNNSGIPAAGLGNNDVGVFELEGWTFTNKDFWKFSGQSASRVDPFTKGDGNIALADSDEYDDLAGGAGKTRPMDTILSSPTLNVAGLNPGTLMLQFDSAWEPEGSQTAVITVDYGAGEVEVLRWESGGPLLHATNYNETVRIPLNNPAGSSTAKIAFKYLNGGNNWFWAVDNIAVGAVPEPSSVMLSCVALAGLGMGRRRS